MHVFKIITWNVKYLGCTENELANENLQASNAVTQYLQYIQCLSKLEYPYKNFMDDVSN
jgi:hypothetical protein